MATCLHSLGNASVEAEA